MRPHLYVQMVIVGASLVGLATLAPLGGADATATVQHETATAKKHSVDFYFQHPCVLFTKGQFQSVFGVAFAGKGERFGDGCTFSSTSGANVNASFVSGSAKSQKSSAAGNGTIVEEHSVGHNAWCQTGSNGASLTFDVGDVEGEANSLTLVTSTCHDAINLAKDLAREFS